jgi:hypothetical protein
MEGPFSEGASMPYAALRYYRWPLPMIGLGRCWLAPIYEAGGLDPDAWSPPSR